MITKYGYDVVGVVLFVVVAGSALSWFFIDTKVVKFGLIVFFFLFLLFTLNFFRDPDRVTPPGDELVIAPADGKIVLVQEIREGEYLKGDAIQVSIFMSPLDVHVNRYPLNGIVGYYQYFPGEFLMAFDEKSSLRNERTHIGVERGATKVLFKQIAGFVARRIVADLKVGDRAVAGQRFGMIKFGSRVDVLIPKRADLRVKAGDTTVAGETVLAIVS